VRSLAFPRRGDVFYADLGAQAIGALQTSEQAGQRPVVIVSRDAFNAARRVVIVAPCTTYSGRVTASTPPRDPSEVLLQAGEAQLPFACIALVGQVRALDKRRLRRLGALSPPVLRRIDAALLDVLDL
jgi:mRNA interferase MazF